MFYLMILEFGQRSHRKHLTKEHRAKTGFESITSINYIDGVRITFANGDIVHLRPSGNAPQFRVYANASTQERASEIVKTCISEPDSVIRRMERGME